MVITYLFFLVFWHLQKMECVGHIQKRLGKRLRDLKKKTFVDEWLSEENKVGREGMLDGICHQFSIGLLWRVYPQFSWGRGWNVQSDLGSVSPFDI